MDNFNIYPKTHIFFGTNQITPFFDEIKRLNYKNILLAYGHNSIKTSGLYDVVIDQLKRINARVSELSGIDPNPRLSTVNHGIDVCKEDDIDFILAVGGGSTIDCVKAIAAGALLPEDQDIWETMSHQLPIKGALPSGNILTLSATGSETNYGFVISNEYTLEKIGYRSYYCTPQLTLLDPTNTYTVNAYQTAAGCCDILSHVLEQYFNSPKDAFVTDQILEGLAKTVIKYTPIALKDPKNYEARSNLMWCGTMALNYISGAGRFFERSVHTMEHALSAHHDITHGVGLAILYPHFLEYVLSDSNVHRYNSFFSNVFNIPLKGDKIAHAKEGIKALYDFFVSLSIPMSLKDVDIPKEELETIATSALKALNIDQIGSLKPLKAQDILEIYNRSYEGKL